MNEQNVINAYVNEYKTLRTIAAENNTDHHRIKRILQKNGVELNNANRKRNPFTAEHRRKIGQASKGRQTRLGMKATKLELYKNMVAHMELPIELEFVMQFEDVEKLKFLNSVITRDRVKIHFDTEKYKAFIKHFYNDKQFNEVYNDWLQDKQGYALPSLDHIIPLSRGGSWDIENLQFLPWCVNRAKSNFLPDEWEHIKDKYFK